MYVQNQQQQQTFVYPTASKQEITATTAGYPTLNELNPMNYGQIFRGGNVYGADLEYAYPPTPTTPIQTSATIPYTDAYRNYVQQQPTLQNEPRLSNTETSSSEERKCDEYAQPESPSHSMDDSVVEGEVENENVDANEAMIILLDWDDTLFPTTWLNKLLQARDKNDLCMVHDDQIDALNALGDATLSLLTRLIRTYDSKHIHIVTNSLEGWIAESLSYAACICKIYKQIQELIADAGILCKSAQTMYAQKDDKESTPLRWKQLCFDDIFAPDNAYSHVLSVGDQWTDHCAVQKTKFVQQAYAPTHHIVKLKMSPTLCDLTNEIRYLSTCFAQIFDVISSNRNAAMAKAVKPVIIDYETEEMKLFYKNISTHFNVNLNVNVNVNINK